MQTHQALIFCLVVYQKRPVILPFSSMSILSAAGRRGRPGMVIISPVSTTMKPAPAEILTFLTVTVKPSGAPSRVGSSEKLYCVLAMQTGRPPKPSEASLSICLRAAGRILMPLPP